MNTENIEGYETIKGKDLIGFIAKLALILGIVGLMVSSVMALNHVFGEHETEPVNAELFKEAATQNQELQHELMNALDCHEDTYCTIVFVGSGFAIISIEGQGLEDQVLYDYMSLGQAKEIVRVNQ